MDLGGFTVASREVLACASREAATAGNAHVGVEHFFLALLQVGGPDVRRALQAASVDPERMEKVMRAWVRLADPAPKTADLLWTPRLERVQTSARLLSVQHSAPGVEPCHFLLALLQESRAAPVRLLEAIRPSAEGPVSACARRESERLLALHERGETAHEGPFFERFLELERTPLRAVCGRDREASWVLEECAQGRFPLLLGDPGLGKRSVMRKAATLLAAADGPQSLCGHRLLRLSPASLRLGLREGRPAGLQIEDFVEGVAQDPTVILMLEDLPALLEDSERVPTGLLCAGIRERRIRCAATATAPEFARIASTALDLAPFFSPLSLGKLSAERIQEVLISQRPALEKFHDVRLSDQALLAAAELTDRFVREEQLPGKALDLLDAACALPLLDGLLPKLGMGESLVVPEMREVGAEAVSAALARTLHVAHERIATGPIVAMRQVLAQHQEAQPDLDITISDSPDGSEGCHLLLRGPAEFRCTELAKELAQAWAGSSARLMRFELDEFVGQAGAEELLALLFAQLHKSPWSVFLFVGIQGADPDVAAALVRVLPFAQALSISSP